MKMFVKWTKRHETVLFHVQNKIFSNTNMIEYNSF